MKLTPAQQAKVHKVLHEFKHGTLHQGSSKSKVTDRRQAIAIAMRAAGVARKAKARS